tara:strand:+ start:134 stop:544 length:411 start_codon:yes stop_codon:yes gene_type:complete
MPKYDKIILLFSFLTFSGLTYASFPITEGYNSATYNQNLDYNSPVHHLIPIYNVDVEKSIKVKRLYRVAAILLSVVVLVLSIIIFNAFSCLNDRSRCNNEQDGNYGALFILNILATVAFGLAIRGRNIKRKENSSK